MYRPPQACLEFWDQVDEVLSCAAFRSHEKILCGDFNVDATEGVARTTHYDALRELCAAHDLKFDVAGTTRIGFRSPPSTLDLILTSAGSSTAASNLQVVDIPFSDHSLVRCDLKVDITCMPRRLQESRNLAKINIEKFRQDLGHQPLARVREFSDVNDMWSFWLTQFMSVLDDHAPLHCRRPRKKRTVPWMNADLLRLIALRRRLHRSYIRQNRSAEAYALFKAARAEANQYNRRLKSEYFLHQCTLHSNDSKRMWHVINTVTGRTRNRVDPGCSVHAIAAVYHEIVPDTTRPTNLNVDLGPSPTQPLLKSFSPVPEEKVLTLLRQIKTTKATGSDGVPGMLLKICADIIAPSLTHIINTSLATGCIPSSMKIANISPLHKGGDRLEPKNYRPVSLLPIVSKILERIVHEQVEDYLQQHSLLPCTQFAYRRQHSTEDVRTIASERLLAARDCHMVSAAVFVDLSKAFDKVRHVLLIQQLHRTGFAGIVLNWFKDYLSHRQQRVVVGTEKSSLQPVTCGVPQGSVLGPTLFSLYVADIVTAVKPSSVKVLQFADDIMLQDSNPQADDVEHSLTEAVTTLALWLRARGLILNEKKSQVLWIPPTKETQIACTIRCGGISLPNVSTARYLGVTFDQGLTWNQHIANKAKSSVKAIGILYRARNSLSLKAKWTYYSSVIMTNLIYGSNAFIANLPVSCLQRLIKLQKKALRAIFGLPYWISTAPIFIRFNESTIYDRMLRKLAVLVWRAQYGNCSLLLADIFNPRLTRPTRGSTTMCLTLPSANRMSGLRRPAFQGSVLWNSLPAAARLASVKLEFLKLLPQRLPTLP